MRQAAPARAMWLIAQLRLRRMWNMFAGFRLRPAKPGSRPATRAKKRAGWVLSLLVGALMLFSFANVARQSVINIQCYLEPSSACIKYDARHKLQINEERAAQELHGTPFTPAVAAALTLQLSILFVTSVLLPLSSKEIAQADWDLEWLVTLPASRSTLLWGRVFERTLVNPTGWIMITPVCAVLAWYSGMGLAMPLVAVACALVLLASAAMLRTLADTGLRMSCPPSQLRNLQAMAAILGMPLIYFALSFGQMHSGSPVIALAKAAPQWLVWTPPGLLVRAVNAGTLAASLPRLALLAGELTLVLWGGMRLLRYQLRHGVVASGSRESARSVQRPAAATGLARLLPRSPVKRRELRLLARDRNFLIQSVLLPIILVGSQLIFTGSADAFHDLADSPQFLAGMASGIASYMLMLSAFQTLNNEGQSLWMLYTFPRSIQGVLREKAQFWGMLALLYPTLLLAAALWAAPQAAASTLRLFAVVLVGVPIFSVIAVSLGVFASDPLAQDTRTKIKPSYAYLYMLLSGMMVYAVSAPLWSQTLVVVILLASLALALWQKAGDHLPYLLDPAAAPPVRVSTADGLMAAVLFFVLQSVLLYVFIKIGRMQPGDAIAFAFSIAGLLVYVITRLVYLLLKTENVPAMLGPNAGASAAWGAGAGLVVAVIGIAYLNLIHHFGLFSDAQIAGAGGLFKVQMLFTLAVVAAPLAEEFIFRGLVFGGLRRTMGLGASMVMSAALFAIVHPPASMLPVFVLGLGAALLYDRTRSLLAPVLMHAVYNAAVIGYQVFL